MSDLSINNLTMIVIAPNNRHELEGEIDKTVQSLKSACISNIVIADTYDLSRIRSEVRTDWFGYLFVGETMDKGLILTLSAYLNSEFEVITLFCKHPNGKLSQAPRLFRKHVIGFNMTSLVNADKWKVTRALDGGIQGK